MRNERLLPSIAFATVCLVWGTTYLAIRIALESLPPVLLTGARFSVAGIILLLILVARGERIPRDPSLLGHTVLVGFLLIGIGNLTVVWAEKWVPSGMAALLVATAPFWATLLEALRQKGERVELRRLLGMLTGFVGVALLVTPGGAGQAWDHHFILGALAIQVGVVAWQAGSVHGKYRLASVKPLMSAALQMLFGGLILDVIGILAGELPQVVFTRRSLVALAYLTVFGSVITYTAYTYALTKMRTTTTSLYSYVNPLVAVVLGWFVMNEQLNGVSSTAMVVIMAGMVLVQTAPKHVTEKLPVVNEQQHTA